MIKQEIASLACKILGIYMTIQGINVMMNVISINIFTPQQTLNYVIMFPFLFLIIIGVLLWPFSDKLAPLMIKGESQVREDSDSRLTADDIQRVAFSVIGLLFFGNSIPKLISALVSLQTVRGLPNPAGRVLGSFGGAGAIAQFILGLGFFLGSQGLVNLLHSVRHAGLRRENYSEDEE